MQWRAFRLGPSAGESWPRASIFDAPPGRRARAAQEWARKILGAGSCRYISNCLNLGRLRTCSRLRSRCFRWVGVRKRRSSLRSAGSSSARSGRAACAAGGFAKFFAERAALHGSESGPFAEAERHDRNLTWGWTVQCACAQALCEQNIKARSTAQPAIPSPFFALVPR
jgi:hypothetical protein